MCYKSPGPRCSAHALSRLKKAKASGSPTAIAEAKKDFYLSPAGIKALRDAGREAQADTAQQLRQELINLSKAHAKLKAKNATLLVETVPVSTDEDNEEDRYVEVSDEDYARLLEEARNPSTPPEQLTNLLYECEDEDLWVAVAMNPSTPISTLKMLSKDSEEFLETNRVAEEVARNPSTPPKLLKKLSKHWGEDVRAAVAMNPNTPPKTLTKLSEDEDEEGMTTIVPLFVADNLSTPLPVVYKLRDEYRLTEEQEARLSAALTDFRRQEWVSETENLDDTPDEWIEKTLWG